MSLKNLYMRSVALLSTLYGLLFALFIGIAWVLSDAYENNVIVVGFVMSPLVFAAIGALLMIFFQFLISPFILDFQLRWVYNLTWIQPGQLPIEMAEALHASIQKHRFSVKKVGIIHDQSPTAFTYGHFKKNARIVVSDGLLNLLTPEERVAVLEHEIGHIVHMDFVFMTLAQAVPLIFYLIYRYSREISRGIANSESIKTSKSNSNDATKYAIATSVLALSLLAYMLHKISSYLVLFLSRTREKYADQFSGLETNNPNALSSALVKISFGLVVADSQTRAYLQNNNLNARDRKMRQKQSSFTQGIRAMNIADVNTAKGLVMQAYTSVQNNEVSPEAVAHAAAWDLTTPWAKFIELSSTHPLTGKRLKDMNDLAEHLGQIPKYPELGTVKPEESLWDEFFMDLFLMNVAPSLIFILPAIGFVAGLFYSDPNIGTIIGLGVGLVIAGFIWLYRVKIKYPSVDKLDDYNYERNTIIEALTSTARDSFMEASPFRGIPIVLEGIVIGRGTPGYYLSDDFVLRDEGGLIRIQYSSTVPFYSYWFALRKLPEMMNQKVRLIGWYHRSIAPYVQLYKVIRMDGKAHKNRWRGLNRIFAIFLIGIGIIIAILPILLF